MTTSNIGRKREAVDRAQESLHYRIRQALLKVADYMDDYLVNDDPLAEGTETQRAKAFAEWIVTPETQLGVLGLALLWLHAERTGRDIHEEPFPFYSCYAGWHEDHDPVGALAAALAPEGVKWLGHPNAEDYVLPRLIASRARAAFADVKEVTPT